jgi:hypothetical protein
MNTSTKNRNRKGGFTAFYNSVASPNDYILNNDIATTLTSSTIAPVTQPPNVYVPPNGDATAAPATFPTWDPSSLNLYPNITTGGRGTSRGCLTRDCDAYEFDNSPSFLYSLKGGCSCSTSSLMGGGNDNRELRLRDRDTREVRKGGDFVITPFITAISLLAARLLADKNGPLPLTGGGQKRRSSQRRN